MNTEKKRPPIDVDWERLEDTIEKMRKVRKGIDELEEILEMQVGREGTFDELDSLGAEIKRLEEELLWLLEVSELQGGQHGWSE